MDSNLRVSDTVIELYIKFIIIAYLKSRGDKKAKGWRKQSFRLHSIRIESTNGACGSAVRRYVNDNALNR